MDIPLQTTHIAPSKPVHLEQRGAMIPPKVQQTALQKPTATVIPAELGVVAAVNESRMSGQKPTVLDAPEVDRILKPYGVSMLPRNETGEKLTQHRA